MKTFVQEIWNGEPVIFIGIVLVILSALATAGIIPTFIVPIATGIASVVQRQKVTPVKK